MCCDLLKIHYLCGDKDNGGNALENSYRVVICSKFITFAVTKTTYYSSSNNSSMLWFAQNSLPLRWQRQWSFLKTLGLIGCDLLKIHYLCGDKDNLCVVFQDAIGVVICSKFITFAVTKTIEDEKLSNETMLWFAQNSLPLRWQRQYIHISSVHRDSCDLLKIHYLCGDKDNLEHTK